MPSGFLLVSSIEELDPHIRYKANMRIPSVR
jgi:hypothetical protein